MHVCSDSRSDARCTDRIGGAAIATIGVLLLSAALPARAVHAQRGTPPPEGLRENTPTVHALVGARIVVAPGRVIEEGTLVLRDGLIEAVGADVVPPPEARVWDLTGKTLYPGLIDPYNEYSTSTSSDVVGNDGYWNANVLPQLHVERLYKPDAALNRKLRGQGITSRLIVPSSGIIRGTSAVVTTGDGDNSQTVLKDQAALHLKLTVQRGGNRDNYPNSPMGAVALVRQAFYDADWYRKAWEAYRTRDGVPRPEFNAALNVLQHYSGDGRTVIVDTSNERYFFRADRLANEFGLNMIVRGSGREYRRLDAIRATGRPVIVPVNFPKAPDVKSPEVALSASLEDLMHWDLAPENPGRLQQAGVRIALTTHGLDDADMFLSRVRTAIQRGLSPEAALRAVTLTPAELLGMGTRLGSLEAGKAAHVVVTDGDLFDKKTKVLETWIEGRRYESQSAPLYDVRGNWEATLATGDEQTETVEITLTGEPTKLSGSIKRGDKTQKLKSAELSDAQFVASFDAEALDWDGFVSLSAVVSQDDAGELTWLGTVAWADGSRQPLAGRRIARHGDKPEPQDEANEKSENEPENADDDEAAPELAAADEPADEEPADDEGAAEEGAAEDDSDDEEKSTDDAKPDESKKALYDVLYPLGEFGLAEPPEQPAVVAFTGATVWTSGPDGVLENATVLVRAGKIAAVGTDVSVPEGALVVDVAGKHLTPGNIDCHSHIATDGGVNESGQAITAEVRIGDFIDSDDINIYRQLAGGVTSSNILHGSANPIGGQNQVIKMRWGALPEEIKFEGAKPGIKFALGENVKQSNWGDRYTSRYPQTRMGVEQIMLDEFEAALDYQRRWDEWRRTGSGLPPRVDLELEAIAEVLRGERLIHCHSYRQDEILALLRTCERYGIQIGTLQHVLEGYKVADQVARHGAGASSFSDWWAFKFEVYDAIPYNGALLHNAGVVVSFNSDDAEHARRLNLEASKAVKYGGVPEAEALKFVTLNPARQLRIDDRVGSIEVGKDADLVVWSEAPLSNFTRCEQTWIDGRKYFDREDDLASRGRWQEMRARLVQKVLKSGAAMETAEDRDKRQDELWPREDIYCGHHDHHHGQDHHHHHDE